MVHAEERPADGRRSTRWTVDEVLAAVGQAGDNAAAIARTVSAWATPPYFPDYRWYRSDLPVVHGTRRYHVHNRRWPPRNPVALR